MRTTLNVNDRLLIKAKRRAARDRLTLTALVEEALRRHLDGRDRPVGKIPEIPVLHGGGLQPGVDLTNNAALAELLDDGKPGR